MKVKCDKDKILLMAMKDSIIFRKVVLLSMIFFEILMIALWCFTYYGEITYKSICYLIGYVSYLLVCGIMFAFTTKAATNIKKWYKAVSIVQVFFGAACILWALWITYLDAKYSDSFSVLVFVTIITIVPIFTFISPLYWVPMHILSTVVLFAMAHVYERYFFSFAVNYTIFSIISVIAAISIYHIRLKNYIGQIELENLYLKNKEYAYIDVLTGLANDRRFFEEMDAYSKSMPKNLVLAVFDLNRLKYVNDNMGHVAGDELICAAAENLQNTFGSYGIICRVGGDEFYGIFQIESLELQNASEHLLVQTAEWQGKYSSELSISMGFAESRNYPDKKIEELRKIADQNMYEHKKDFYAQNGFEQR